MEKQNETIKPVEEETLDQVTGGVDILPDELKVKTQENVNFPPTVQPNFI